MSFSPSQQPESTSTNTLPTPADSSYGLSSLADSHPGEKKDAAKKEEEDEGRIEVQKDNMDIDPATESNPAVAQAQCTAVPAGPSTADTKTVSVEITLEQIQKDMGTAFQLCRTKLHPSRPNPSEHLLSRYGLGPLVATVARTDPKTGEKINKLRKSYEGQIKTFGLAGRNKPDKRDDNPLLTMMDWPEQEWHVQKVASKNIAITDDFKSRLQNAVKMEPGSVRNQAEWDNLMGHEKPVRTSIPAETRQDPVATPTARPSVNGGLTAKQQQQQQNELHRPRRAGKKRSYDDNSFVGYGEGFLDDDGDTYSSDDRGQGRKKRKKVSLEAGTSIAPE